MKKEKNDKEILLNSHPLLKKLDGALMPEKLGVDKHRNYKAIMGRGV